MVKVGNDHYLQLNVDHLSLSRWWRSNPTLTVYFRLVTPGSCIESSIQAITGLSSGKNGSEWSWLELMAAQGGTYSVTGRDSCRTGGRKASQVHIFSVTRDGNPASVRSNVAGQPIFTDLGHLMHSVCRGGYKNFVTWADSIAASAEKRHSMHSICRGGRIFAPNGRFPCRLGIKSTFCAFYTPRRQQKPMGDRADNLRQPERLVQCGRLQTSAQRSGRKRNLSTRASACALESATKGLQRQSQEDTRRYHRSPLPVRAHPPIPRRQRTCWPTGDV